MEIPQPGSDYKRFEKQFFPDEQSIMVNATIKAVKNGNWTIYGDVFSVRNAKYLVVSNNDSYIHDGPFLPLSITSTRALVCPMIIDFDTGNFHYLMDIIPTSPLKQYECGIPIEKIQCNDKLILLQKLSDESISCVTLDTSMSLVERGWGQYLQYPNSEEINYGKDMMELIEYTVRGASDISIKPDAAAKSLIIEIATVADGNLNISIPKMLANMMFGPNTSIGNDSFFVLVDGAEVDYEEKPATKAYRNLAIPFEIGNTQIEIIGTYP